MAEDGGGEGSEAAGEEREDVQGFVFSRLKSLHPDKGDKLAEMKQYLLGEIMFYLLYLLLVRTVFCTIEINQL